MNNEKFNNEKGSIILPIFIVSTLLLFLSSCQISQDNNTIPDVPTIPESCAELKNSFKDFCILNLTMMSDRISDCSLIANLEIKDLCYLKISAEKNDTGICSDVKLPENVELCYFGIAVQTKNPAICEKMPENSVSIYKKNVCIKMASLKEENPKHAAFETQNAQEKLTTVYYKTTIAQDDLLNAEIERINT